MSGPPTKERLARALEEALCPAAMVERARAGHYDSWESPLALPLVELVGELHAIGQTALAQRVREGEFDGTRAEADAWMRSDEAQTALGALARPPRRRRRRRS